MTRRVRKKEEQGQETDKQPRGSSGYPAHTDRSCEITIRSRLSRAVEEDYNDPERSPYPLIWWSYDAHKSPTHIISGMSSSTHTQRIHDTVKQNITAQKSRFRNEFLKSQVFREKSKEKHCHMVVILEGCSLPGIGCDIDNSSEPTWREGSHCSAVWVSFLSKLLIYSVLYKEWWAKARAAKCTHTNTHIHIHTHTLTHTYTSIHTH